MVFSNLLRSGPFSYRDMLHYILRDLPLGIDMETIFSRRGLFPVSLLGPPVLLRTPPVKVVSRRIFPA